MPRQGCLVIKSREKALLKTRLIKRKQFAKDKADGWESREKGLPKIKLMVGNQEKRVC